MRTKRLQPPAFNSIFSYILVWFIGFVYLQSNLLNWQRTECSSVFPHHHHHDMYLQLYQRISVITACIFVACICGNLQCGLLHDTGLALLQIMTTNYYSKKSFNLIRRILNIYNSSWNTNWEYGELFQRSLYFKIIICNCSFQCNCTGLVVCWLVDVLLCYEGRDCIWWSDGWLLQ